MIGEAEMEIRAASRAKHFEYGNEIVLVKLHVWSRCRSSFQQIEDRPEQPGLKAPPPQRALGGE